MATVFLVIVVITGLTLFYYSRPILIGVIIPTQTNLGNEENLYARYYRDTHPRIGLRKINFIIENQAVKEQEIKDAYNKMIKMGVSAIIGGVISQEGIWLSEESKKSSVPTFGITTSSSLLSKKKDAFFRVVPTNDGQANAVAEYYNKLGMKKLVLVTSTENKAYADPIVKIIQDKFKGEVWNIPFYSDEETYTKILSKNPDSIFCILDGKNVMDVIKKFKEKQSVIKIGSSSWGSSEILTLYSSSLLDGVLLFSSSTNLIGEEYKAEIADFEMKYNIEATKGSHYTSSVLNILYKGLTAVGGSRESLKTYFETPRIYNAAYGKASIDEYGDSSLNIVIVLELRDGKVIKEEILK